MEDYARFVLDDVRLSERAKAIRHDLEAVLGGSPLRQAIRCRDIVDDVGRDSQAEGEYRRERVEDVVAAAGKRLSEGLRVIEEYGKTVSADLGRAVERLRYEGYEVERQLMIRQGSRERLACMRLYVLLTASLCRGDWFETAQAAVAGGADCLQLREKELPDGELLGRARRLASLCREAGALFLVNDRPDVAVAAGADGVHVGQDDLPVGVVRRIVGPGLIVGVSTHTIDQARQAVAAAPDYMAVGPMFQSGTKPQPHVPGPALVREVRSSTSAPLVAIGGLTAENAGEVVEAGADCVCACASIIAAEDVREAAGRLKQVIARAAERR